MGRYFDDFAHSGMEEEDDILHYGVLGMKWGIRRYQPYSYTGGSGKEVGEAKKLAKLSAKSAKLDKKINKLEKKRTNRFAIATNARVRGRAGDKQQKLIKKKEKIDTKIRYSKEVQENPKVKAVNKKVDKAYGKYMDLHYAMRHDKALGQDRSVEDRLVEYYNDWMKAADERNKIVENILDDTKKKYTVKR